MREIKGTNLYNHLKAVEMYLVLNVIIPNFFKSARIYQIY
jgi:hypothetical protein